MKDGAVNGFKNSQVSFNLYKTFVVVVNFSASSSGVCSREYICDQDP